MPAELFMRGVKANTVSGKWCAVFFYPDTQEFFVLNEAADGKARDFAKNNRFIDGEWSARRDESARFRAWLVDEAAATGSRPIDAQDPVTLRLLTAKDVDSVVSAVTISRALDDQRWTTWISGNDAPPPAP
jgi:hypothetical protein